MTNILEQTEKITNSPVKTIGDIIEAIKENYCAEKYEKPVDIGFTSTKPYIKGIRRNEIIILAGRTSMGKSSSALNIVVNMLKQGKKILIFDLEEQQQENILRLLTILSGYNLKEALENENITDSEREDLFILMKESYKKLSDCSACWDGSAKAVRMKESNRSHACPVCNNINSKDNASKPSFISI